MRPYLSLCLTLILCLPSLAQPAAIKLAIAQAERQRESNTKAKALAMLAIAKAQANRRANECMNDPAAALERSRVEGKPVFFWVGMTCHDLPALRATFTGEAIHCHMDSANGSAKPRLVVQPIGRGGMGWPKEVIGTETPAQIREFLRQKTSAVSMTVECRT